MKIKKKYSGVVVPMITPLTKNLNIDTRAVISIMECLAQNNISPLLLGTTGEASSISQTESIKLIENAAKHKKENQILYVGLANTRISELIENAILYTKSGADVIVVTLPPFYTLSAAQMETYYSVLAENSPKPIMIYNIKATTQMSIPLDTISRLSMHPNIVGLKDSERDLERLISCCKTYQDRPDFSFLCGWGAQSSFSLQIGADGIVPSTGNITPKLYSQMINAFNNGDIETMENLQKLTDQIAQIYQKNKTLGESIGALKVMMKEIDLCDIFMMPPLSTLSNNEEQAIKTNMKLWEPFIG